MGLTQRFVVVTFGIGIEKPRAFEQHEHNGQSIADSLLAAWQSTTMMVATAASSHYIDLYLLTGLWPCL